MAPGPTVVGTRFSILLVIFVALGIALRAAIWLHDDKAAPDRNWFVEDLYFPTWNRLDDLFAGVTLAAVRTFRQKQWERWSTYVDPVLFAGLTLVGCSFVLFADRAGLLGNAVGWPVLSTGFALIVFAGAQRSGWLTRLKLPGAAWVSAVSYSLYLVHKPIYHLVQVRLGSILNEHGVLAFASYGGASLGAAALLHYLVERPGLRLRGRWLSHTRRTGPLYDAS